MRYGFACLVLMLLVVAGATWTLERRTNDVSKTGTVLPAQTPYTKQGTDVTFKIVRPTVFFFLRSRDHPRNRAFKEKMEKLVVVANAARAREFGFDPNVLDPWVENICLIEEETYWTVAMFERGNSFTFREADGWYVSYDPMRYQQIYYIDKVTQTLLHEAPRNAITWVPPYGPGLVLEIRTSYPDENVGSFTSNEEATRRTWDRVSRERAGESPESEERGGK